MTVIEKGAVLAELVEFVAVTTKPDTVPIVVGVPPSTPVVEFKLSPAGSAGETENVGAGYHTLAEAFSGWRDSPSHRGNMLVPGATRMGIAAVYTPSSKYKVFWSLILAAPGEKRG